MSAPVRWHAACMAEVPADAAWHDERLAARLATMRFTKRRDEAELGRWTAKQALARALGIDHGSLTALRQLVVLNAADGAPEAFIGMAPAGVRIAMTDRSDWAVCTVLEGVGDIGCDLEVVEPRSVDFVRDYFTPAEQELVAAIGDRALSANLIWSAKESALKVLRTGLRRDTRSVEVTLDPTVGKPESWSPLVIRDLITGDNLPGHWIRFGDFLLTIAAREDYPNPVSFDEPSPLSQATPSHAWMTRPTAHRD